ncbi:hypothetical protein QBC46DRAFT_348228 [Diplogelasinospora grovesii]|uniref:Uncharacterized protein n=1 Tax=Diplogelasinospora grovesii TaxID=303347 RepID=A0AAN6RXT6_9PEZI|nr:hypothetical protein QBC46DRAFT_348228 [Diplogelasinospora grovesii]
MQRSRASDSTTQPVPDLKITLLPPLASEQSSPPTRSFISLILDVPSEQDEAPEIEPSGSVTKNGNSDTPQTASERETDTTGTEFMSDSSTTLAQFLDGKLWSPVPPATTFPRAFRYDYVSWVSRQRHPRLAHCDEVAFHERKFLIQDASSRMKQARTSARVEAQARQEAEAFAHVIADHSRQASAAGYSKNSHFMPFGRQPGWRSRRTLKLRRSRGFYIEGEHGVDGFDPSGDFGDTNLDAVQLDFEGHLDVTSREDNSDNDGDDEPSDDGGLEIYEDDKHQRGDEPT